MTDVSCDQNPDLPLPCSLYSLYDAINSCTNCSSKMNLGFVGIPFVGMVDGLPLGIIKGAE